MIEKIDAKHFQRFYAWRKGPHIYYFNDGTTGENSIVVQNVSKIKPLYSDIRVFEIDWNSQLINQNNTSKSFLNKVFLSFNTQITKVNGLESQNVTDIFNQAVIHYNHNIDEQSNKLILLAKNKKIKRHKIPQIESEKKKILRKEYKAEFYRKYILQNKLKIPKIDQKYNNKNNLNPHPAKNQKLILSKLTPTPRQNIVTYTDVSKYLNRLYNKFSSKNHHNNRENSQKLLPKKRKYIYIDGKCVHT